MSVHNAILAVLSLLWTAVLAAQEPVGHPRLMMRSVEEPALTRPESRKADSIIVDYCNQLLHAQPVERVMIGRRLLQTSREAMKRIFWLSYTYRVHGGDIYARLAVEEMLAVSRFRDWNPSHFLDVGEMALGVAIGYDWLHGFMTPQEREEISNALIEKGLKPALNEADAWFYTSENNWNAVCNAGMAYAALAVWEKNPEFCRAMLLKTMESNPLALKAYSPEGGYPEGYIYWGYGTSFQIMLDAALESAFESDAYAAFGKAAPDRSAFLNSATFMQFMSTPAGHTFNFSDSHIDANFQYMQAWMALWRGDSSILYPELRLWDMGSRPAEERLLPMFILGLEKMPAEPIPEPAGHFYTCTGTTPVFIYREGWNDRADDYLAIKAGHTQSSHSHCDQGSFFFESDGVTWATDLGMQNYNSLESLGLDLWDMTQDSDRWQVFRIGPFSHNILTVNGHVPKVNHPVAFERTWTGSGKASHKRKGAALDLTEVYSEDLASCRREVWLRSNTLHVKDFLETADTACIVRWAMCTDATPRIEGSRIILEADGHKRVLECRAQKSPYDNHMPATSPVPAIWPAAMHDYDAPNPGKTMVGFSITLPSNTKTTLHTTISPRP